MCSPFAQADCPNIVQKGLKILLGPGADVASNVGSSIVDTIISSLATEVREAVTAMTLILSSWILMPSTDIDFANSPARQLRSYMLPITVLVAVGGLIWQGITLTITRKGEPLLQAVRGVWTTGLWGAIGIAATHAALKAGDSYSRWILTATITGDSAQPPDKTMSAALGAMLLPATGMAPFIGMLVGIIVLLVTIVQLILMVFREGSVVILAGLLQLAAAGTITRGTSPWLQRVLGWTLAMVAYKPMAATIYAVAFMLMSEPGDGRNFIMGLAVLALSVVAMPVLIKFFSWTTGGTSNSGGGLAMAGAAAAAGMHAGASLRGVGGSSARDHADYLNRTLDAAGSGPASPPPGGASSGPLPPPPPPPPSPAGGPAAATAAAPAAAGAAAGAGTSTAGAGAAAATGPAAPIVMAGVTAAKTGAQAATTAARTAADATQQGADR